MSIAILATFEIEFFLSVYLHGLVWLYNLGHCMDIIVVSISLIIDCIEINKPQHELAEITSFLIIIRLWRIARIAHSFTEAVVFELTE